MVEISDGPGLVLLSEIVLTSRPSFIIPVLISGPLVSRAIAKGLAESADHRQN